MPDNATDLADDLLEGADEIGAFIRKSPRQTYYLAGRGEIPVFYIGKILHARKSELRSAMRFKSAAA